jgi:hypothetical protein
MRAYVRRSFEDARAFVRGLKLKSQVEWRTYCRSGKKPDDIPTVPSTVYADAGWVDWSDWLGNPQMRAHVSWRSFEDARAFVRGLKLKSVKEWHTYSKSGNRPSDIPSNPYSVYANAGWVSWGDWLGTGQRQHMGRLRTVIRGPNLAAPRRRHAAAP